MPDKNMKKIIFGITDLADVLFYELMAAGENIDAFCVNKKYITESELHDDKSNKIFVLILNTLDEIPFPIKTKYGIQIENFLFLNWNESNSILYHELQESINDVTHLGFREYISDAIDNIYIDDNEHIIENLNLNHFPELKDFKAMMTIHNDLTQTDHLILEK